MLSPDIEQMLDCICGLCSHDYGDSNCLYNKIIDSPEPPVEMKNQILKLIQKCLKSSASSINTTKTKCGTIKSQKGANKK